MTETQINTLKTAIHTVKDYPKAGIMFRDVTGILDDGEAFKLTIEILANKFKDGGFTKIVGTEARGFLFGAPLALALGLGFVPVRKPGKLPRATFSQDYQLEYGQDTLEIHQDALTKDDKVLIIDDLLATGGTIEATTKLIRRVGAQVTDAAFVISLPDLGGETKLQGMDLSVFSLLQYAGD
ncbi:MAG: adenine phosphoribosyltransferase [Pseudoalteromonas sp.]